MSASLFGDYGWNRGGAWGWDGSLSLRVKPSKALTIESGPAVSRGHTLLQYVRTAVDPYATATYGSRYVFGDIDQTEVSLPTRVNWMFTPRASLQLYVQPLLSVGDYWGFKELARPRVFDYARYGTDIGTIALERASNRYLVDPDGGGPASPFSFTNPDFNFRSIRFNAVFRWEWRLGLDALRRVDAAPRGLRRHRRVQPGRRPPLALARAVGQHPHGEGGVLVLAVAGDAAPSADTAAGRPTCHSFCVPPPTRADWFRREAQWWVRAQKDWGYPAP